MTQVSIHHHHRLEIGHVIKRWMDSNQSELALL